MSALSAEQEVWWRAFEVAYRSRLERGAEPTAPHVLREAASAADGARGYFMAAFAEAAPRRSPVGTFEDERPTARAKGLPLGAGDRPPAPGAIDETRTT